MFSSKPYRNRPTALRSPRILTVCVVAPPACESESWGSLAQANGLRLEVVATADAALRLARTATVDLWVINTKLPALSGFELCEMLKAKSSSTAVYLVAGEYSPAAERAAWAARATMFACQGASIDLVQHWLRSQLATVPSSRFADDFGS